MEQNSFFKENTFDFNNKKIDRNIINEKLENDGIVILTNFCDVNKQNHIRSEFNSMYKQMPKWAKLISKNSGYTIHYSPLVRYINKATKYCKISSTVFKEKILNNLRSKYLNNSRVLERMIYTVDKVSDDPITEWHIDLFPTGSKCLKFFLYLSDTDDKSGAFSYIPSMHSYIHLLHKKYDVKERTKRLFTYENIKKSLIDFSKSLELKSNKNEYHALIKKIKLMDDHIINQDKYDDFFSIPAKAGTLIIFDAAGIHKGGIIQEGERHVIRSHFLEYPLKRALKSKNDLYLYVMNRLCKLKAFLKKEEILF